VKNPPTWGAALKLRTVAASLHGITSYKTVILNDTWIGHLIKILHPRNDDAVVYFQTVEIQY
jgi:hypothetical protein